MTKSLYKIAAEFRRNSTESDIIQWTVELFYIPQINPSVETKNVKKQTCRHVNLLKEVVVLAVNRYI